VIGNDVSFHAGATHRKKGAYFQARITTLCGFIRLAPASLDDPAQSRNERELVSFAQGDPDESQFQPLQGYQIVTQETRSIGC
jgi:hypothetical protein